MMFMYINILATTPKWLITNTDDQLLIVHPSGVLWVE